MVADAGDTDKLAPVPTKVPPQLPEYHCQVALVPSTPPVMLNVVELPTHIGLGAADALAAAVDNVFTVTVTDTHVVVLQVPSART